MKFLYTTILLLAFAVLFKPSYAIDLENETTSKYVLIPFNISVFPGISIGENTANGRKIINRFSVNLIGHAAKLRGAEIGYIWNSYSEDVLGGQYAGVGNWVGGNVVGVQYAGVLNKIGGDFHGAQWAGILNIIYGEMNGVGWAGIVNLLADDGLGGQFAGITNLTHRTFTGVQMAGIYNRTGRRMSGVQWAGIFNEVSGNMTGLQLSGIANSTHDDLNGMQIAGIYNEADVVVKGAQIGLINVSRQNHGLPVGLISYVDDVGLGLDGWYDENHFSSIALRSGNRSIYNIIFAGKRTNESDRWTVGWGIGRHHEIGERLFLETDVTFQHINEKNSKWTNKLNSLTRIRLIGGLKICDRISVYGGPSLNLFVSKNNDGAYLSSYPISKSFEDDLDIWTRSWIGFAAGVRF